MAGFGKNPIARIFRIHLNLNVFQAILTVLLAVKQQDKNLYCVRFNILFYVQIRLTFFVFLKIDRSRLSKSLQTQAKQAWGIFYTEIVEFLTFKSVDLAKLHDTKARFF